MSSGPAATLTYDTWISLNPTDASATNFKVFSIATKEATFKIGDAGNSDGILGNTLNEPATLTSNPPGFFIDPSAGTYWGKTADNSLVLRKPAPKSPDGFTYAMFSNGTNYKTFDEIPRTNFSQSAIVLCFLSGTNIQTVSGEVPVENLKVGDVAITASGKERLITWIGHRHFGAASSLPVDQMPVRIRAGAFGSGLPTRDLRLSPGHPVLVGADADYEGGVLVPVMCLINGTTIAREPSAQVTYWHVELDTHDILFAEGLPAESYIDLGSRPWFDGADSVLFDPNFVSPAMTGRCRPVAVDGPLVEAERARLGSIFAEKLVEDCGWSEMRAFA